MIAAIIRFLRLARLHLLEIEADGYAAAGNRMAELDCCRRIALLRDELRPLGGDDDDEDGTDDDGKVAA